MSEIQKEFNPAARFVQIAAPKSDPGGPALCALDEDGVVWSYEEARMNIVTGKPVEGGWRPLPNQRFPKPGTING